MELFHLVVDKVLSQNNRDNEVSILYHVHYKCYMIIFSLTLCVVFTVVPTCLSVKCLLVHGILI